MACLCRDTGEGTRVGCRIPTETSWRTEHQPNQMYAAMSQKTAKKGKVERVDSVHNQGSWAWNQKAAETSAGKSIALTWSLKPKQMKKNSHAVVNISAVWKTRRTHSLSDRLDNVQSINRSNSQQWSD